MILIGCSDKRPVLTDLPKVLLPSGAAGRPVWYGLQWWVQISRASAKVLVGIGLSARAIKLQDACVLGILNGAEMVLVGEPMMVGSGDFCSQSDVRGDEPSSLVGEEPRLAGRGSCGEWLQDEEEG